MMTSTEAKANTVKTSSGFSSPSSPSMSSAFAVPWSRARITRNGASGNGVTWTVLPNPRQSVYVFALLLWLGLAVFVLLDTLEEEVEGARKGSGDSSRTTTASNFVTAVSNNHNQAPAASVGEYDRETGFYQSIELRGDGNDVSEPLFSKQSKYQMIEVHQSKTHWGKVLVLDGVIQLTERDGDSYNEMMAHMPLFQHPNPKRVLLIGGGDGYVLSEILKHPSVEHVDHVELDRDVIETCQKYFDWGRTAWSDPRVRLHIDDGASFVDKAPTEYYSVVIQDSSDPWTWNEQGETSTLPSSVLYSQQHFRNIHRALSIDGIFSFQAETYHFPSDIDGIVQWRQDTLETGFSRVRYGSITIATYPMGQIGFMMCEKQVVLPESTADSTKHYDRVVRRYNKMVEDGKETTYYHPRLQKSAFDLPLWVEKRLYSSEVIQNQYLSGAAKN